MGRRKKKDESSAVLSHPCRPLSFFKIMIGDFKNRLRIPPKAYPAFKSLVNQDVDIEDSRGCAWSVKVASVDKFLVFDHGWCDFVLDHCIQFGELVLFNLIIGKKLVVARIFSTNACERSIFVEKLDGKDTKKRMNSTFSSPFSDNSVETDRGLNVIIDRESAKKLRATVVESTEIEELQTFSEEALNQNPIDDACQDESRRLSPTQDVSSLIVKKELLADIEVSPYPEVEKGKNPLFVEDEDMFELLHPETECCPIEVPNGSLGVCSSKPETENPLFMENEGQNLQPVSRSYPEDLVSNEDVRQVAEGAAENLDSCLENPNASLNVFIQLEGNVLEKLQDFGEENNILNLEGDTDVNVVNESKVFDETTGDASEHPDLLMESVTPCSEDIGMSESLVSVKNSEVESVSPLGFKNNILEVVRTETKVYEDCSTQNLISYSFFIHSNAQYWIKLPEKLPIETGKLRRKVVVLEDSSKRLWPILYCQFNRDAIFKGGWRDFSQANHLKEGDACELKLVNVSKAIFQVFISRV